MKYTGKIFYCFLNKCIINTGANKVNTYRNPEHES